MMTPQFTQKNDKGELLWLGTLEKMLDTHRATDLFFRIVDAQRRQKSSCGHKDSQEDNRSFKLIAPSMH